MTGARGGGDGPAPAGTAPLTAEAFARATDVSRETLARLEAYAERLRAWQGAVNLVGAATLADVWRRHFLDSAQLLPLLPPGTRTLVDLGSGAGFPGLVLAILGVPDVHLIESNRRKAAFLNEVARVTGTDVTVHAARIEDLPAFPADAVTARACAPLPRLLSYAARFLDSGGVALLLKGREVERELTDAAKTWKMRVERLSSRAGPGGVVLKLRDIRRV